MFTGNGRWRPNALTVSAESQLILFDLERLPQAGCPQRHAFPAQRLADGFGMRLPCSRACSEVVPGGARADQSLHDKAYWGVCDIVIAPTTACVHLPPPLVASLTPVDDPAM